MKRAVSFVFFALVGLAGFDGAAAAHPGQGPNGRGAYMADRRVEVEWGGSWRPSTIVAVRDGQYLVRYDGWSDFFNEWVPESRVRDPNGVVDCEGQPQLAQIQWGGSWRSGRIMKIANGQYLVRYDGWDSFFDEWVGADRVVLTTPVRAVQPVVYAPPIRHDDGWRNDRDQRRGHGRDRGGRR